MRRKKFKDRFKKNIKLKDDGRMNFIRWSFIALASLIILRLFFLQIIQGSFYTALASEQHEIYKTLFPTRGIVYLTEKDSLSSKENLYPVAMNKDYKTLYAQPKFINNPQEVAKTLSPILEISEEDLLLKLDKPEDPYEVLKRKLSDELYDKLKDLNIKGVKFQTENYRYYPEKNIGSNVLGFVSRSDTKSVGQYGVEGYFDEELKGSIGKVRSEKDISGSWIASAGKFYEPAKNGEDIILTLDKNIQFQTCRILNEEAEKFQADSAAAIIMNPFSGEIMAMCSYPDFDPNEYNLVDSVKNYNNTSIFDSYEPGSIFKPITMAAALDMGLVTPETTYIDNGEVKIDKYTIRNSDKKANGKKNMIDVLDLSLNTGMIFVVEKLGILKFKQYVENFGFGKRTGIQLNSESGGNIKSLSKRGKIYSYTASFGQGITATPLQMVQAYSAIVNGGYLVEPYIIDKIKNGDDVVYKGKTKILQKVLDQRTSTLLSGMLVSVVKQGHAKLADVKGYNIGGKTGTAQIPDFEHGGYSNKTNHSFVGFGPLDNPAYVMIVKFENPKTGGYSASTAAPTFGRISKFLLNYLKIPPDNSSR